MTALRRFPKPPSYRPDPMSPEGVAAFKIAAERSTATTREEALASLQRAGIVDHTGRLAKKYRPVKD